MVGFRKKAGRVVKRAVKAGVRAVKKRYAPGGKVNVARIASDAAKLVRLMNVEKKYIDKTRYLGGDFSQASTVTAGYFVEEITPSIAQGVTNGTRNGNSLKLVSARLEFQVKAQSATNNELRYKWYIICRPDCSTDQTAASVVTDTFDENLFGGQFDYHSIRDPEFFKSYKIISQGGGKLLADSIAGQLGINQFHKNLKLSHHYRYNSNGSIVPVVNRMYLVCFADSGDKAINTGAIIDWGARFWYVDN